MDKLIDGILKYSRIGRMYETDDPIDVETLVREVITMLVPPPHIQISIENTLPVVYVNRVKIEQVFQNLIGNALKFTDKPSGHVKIGCQEQAADWIFYVADNGQGIEPQHHERIFKIFQTLKPAETYDGTGIGLTIVKKIIESSGGKIWLQSTVGVGSTFFFTIPKKQPLESMNV